MAEGEETNFLHARQVYRFGSCFISSGPGMSSADVALVCLPRSRLCRVGDALQTFVRPNLGRRDRPLSYCWRFLPCCCMLREWTLPLR
jgi:hypothetical protein